MSRRTGKSRWLGTAALFIFATWAALCAADSRQVDPAKFNDITVVIKDRSIRGALIAYDTATLTIQPMPKPAPLAHGKNSPPPASQPAPITLKWSDIRSVSNGLTQRKALDAWQAANQSQLCPTCHGERVIFCPVCKGTGHDPAALKGCKTCHDELLVDCPTPGCKVGQIPCPNNCLRLGVGRWKKDASGEMWCYFAMRNGAGMSYSEHHIGHVIAIANALDAVNDDGVCPICGGSTRVNDPACLASGKVPCPTCSSRMDAAACPNHCDNGRVPCPDCAGTGLKKPKA